ncbi:hypothetical protein BH23VER1_BH23VER1_12500 [soil metagenome]
MAKDFQLEGTVKVIDDVQTFKSGFTKREFVVEVEDGNYPQMVKFETIKEKTSLLDNLSVGDPVTVNFDIRGNEYNGRYFVNLQAWKINSGGASKDSAPAGEDGPGNFDEPPPGHGEEGDDIPF